jgi:hypothetical protein
MLPFSTLSHIIGIIVLAFLSSITQAKALEIAESNSTMHKASVLFSEALPLRLFTFKFRQVSSICTILLTSPSLSDRLSYFSTICKNLR